VRGNAQQLNVHDACAAVRATAQTARNRQRDATAWNGKGTKRPQQKPCAFHFPPFALNLALGLKCTTRGAAHDGSAALKVHGAARSFYSGGQEVGAPCRQAAVACTISTAAVL
jgi:hypothetical protein